jgi:uncharacterized membrane protein
MAKRYQRDNEKSSIEEDRQYSLWFLLAIVLSVFFDWRLLIIPLVSFGHCIVCLLRLTTSHYPFGIFWPLYCLSSSIDDFSLSLWYLLAIVLSVFFDWRLLIIPLVSVGHCIVCLLRLTTSHYPFGIFWPLYCLSSSIDDFSLSLWYLLIIKRYQRDNEKSSIEEDRQYNSQKIPKG